MKPATISRRGFLRSIGITSCTVLGSGLIVPRIGVQNFDGTGEDDRLLFTTTPSLDEKKFLARFLKIERAIPMPSVYVPVLSASKSVIWPGVTVIDKKDLM